MDVMLGVMDPETSYPGPVDSFVLYDQEKHVSSAVWDGQERGALRCHEHTSKLDQWRLTAKQIELVEKAGFGYLRLIPAISLDNPLISALVERWRRETNTFHMTVGEMTVTLKDVAFLLGLAIDGEPVIGVTYTSCNSVCERYLGRVPAPGYAMGGMVKLSWLKEYFSQCPEEAPIEVIEYHTRAYLLYLIGSTIFSTTTGNKVPVMYLPLLENFDHARKYAWGAAALAFLYRTLGNASLRTQSTISGCLTLLQCWSYFHLNVGRPNLSHNPMQDRFPFVLRWKGKQIGPTTNRDVLFYRKALDSLQPSDVEWVPYRNKDSTVIPENIKHNSYLWRSRTMLICFDKAERHLPDRCLRQYGMLQPIPDDVQRWERKTRGVDGGIDLSGKMESELNEWRQRECHIVKGYDAVDEIEYMDWYLRITRKFIGRPISLSFEFQRMNAGLRDIAHIVDAFPIKGLNQQQIDAISQIRYIAHDCLRDQSGFGSVAAAATSPADNEKRTRGKEQVRRKSVVKRRRKDDMMQYHVGSKDDQSQYCGSIIPVDRLQLHETETGIDQFQLSHQAAKVETSEMDDRTDKETGMQLDEAPADANDLEISNLTDEVNSSQLHDSTAVDLQPGDAKNDDPQPSSTRVNDSQSAIVNIGHALPFEVNDSNLQIAGGNFGDLQPTDVNTCVLQLEDAATEVYDSQMQIDASQLNDAGDCHITTNNGTLASQAVVDLISHGSTEGDS